jgi:amino acid transporter
LEKKLYLLFTGEEVKNPKKALPLSILLTLVICTLMYLSASVVITLMIPYFLVDTYSPLSSAFDYANMSWAQYIIMVGAVVSLATWYVNDKIVNFCLYNLDIKPFG